MLKISKLDGVKIGIAPGITTEDQNVIKRQLIEKNVLMENEVDFIVDNEKEVYFLMKEDSKECLFMYAIQDSAMNIRMENKTSFLERMADYATDIHEPFLISRFTLVRK